MANGTSGDGTSDKPPSGEEGVLGNLPATRPSRMSRRARTADTGSADEGPPPTPAAGGERRPARAAAERKATKPRAVRAASPDLREPARKADAARESATADTVEPRPQGGAELVTTVVKAAGELAHIGLTVGGQILKRALPKRH